MQLAILHYHLSSGGVARVVQNHLLALAQVSPEARPERVLLVEGGRGRDWHLGPWAEQLPFPIHGQAIEGLDYDAPDAVATGDLATALESMLLAEGYRPEETVLHWHNHSLGKNVSVPLAVRRLAERGYRLLLQIHDFAEDFRPDNYRKLATALAEGDEDSLPEVLYPQAEHLHYATLNSRDHQVLSQAGVVDERLHLLPNPVSPPERFDDAPKARRLVYEALELPNTGNLLTYTVRGIRRKNLGEMLLCSTLCEDSWLFVTLAPQNPAERASFDRWKRLSEELGLPCRFGMPAGADLSFSQILAASDALVTTSIAEGFGMAFLEAWLAGRLLLGRDLPEITSDFRQTGLDLSDLYCELLIPTAWVDRRQFVDQLGRTVAGVLDAFGRSLPSQAELDRQIGRLLDGPTVDFARLPGGLQTDMIRRTAGSEQDRRQVLELNPRLQFGPERFTGPAAEERIAANAAVVGESFSLAALGAKLSDIYTRLMVTSPGDRLEPPAAGSTILDTMLRIDRFHAIRVEP